MVAIFRIRLSHVMNVRRSSTKISLKGVVSLMPHTDANKAHFQGPRSNFWIEGAECLASQGRGGGWATIESPFLLRSFSTFFGFSSTILWLRRVHVYCWAFFRSLLVNVGKNLCMFFRPNPFAFFLLDVRVHFPKITAKMLMRCS